MQVEGLIPAHAGKTRRYPVIVRPRRAHPRSRGENATAARYALHGRGSSPLTRGKLNVAYYHGGVVGLIPAHAGKTSVTHWRPLRSRAHPRSRGENLYSTNALLSVPGSSPLTRGKQLVLSVFLGGRGLIPAHAGKTWPVRAVSRFPGAHPRSRGENTRFCNEILLHPGSSPLTRGKHSHRNEQIPVPGLIPAHAGKTVMRPGPGGASWAHPRSRGENR